MPRLRFIILFLLGAGLCNAQNPDVEVNNERKIKGQQSVTQTVVAKVVGSTGFSEEFMAMLRNNHDIPIVVDNTTLVEGSNGTGSALVTENIKTTVTRITIPLSTNFMDSEWYRETLQKFLQKNRVALRNSTVESGYSEQGADIELVILKLWAAATLRDNIITVFGSLLYNPDRKLPRDLHSSLVHLYELIRLRRISTIAFLDVLEEMSFENSQEQFKILFQKFEKHVPKYLKSCSTYWLENLYTNAINMGDFLIDKDGVLIADFLSGIDSSALLPLKQRVLFPRSTVMGSQPEDEEIMGKMVSYVLSGIREKTITLSRQIFAGILLHLPLNELTPDADEYERFFVDMVKDGSADEDEKFNEASNNLDYQQFTDPFQMMRSVFKSLLSGNFGNRELYESILVNIERPRSTYALRDHDILSPIISSKRINIKDLLRNIAVEEYPPDIVNAKDRVLYYIDKNYIDLDFVLRGFIKYQHINPTDFLISVLTRITVMVPDLSPEILNTVNSLKTHISYKKSLNNLRFKFSVADLTALLLSFQSPDLPENIRNAAINLKTSLQNEFLDADHNLNKQSTSQCNSPRQCVVIILKSLLIKGQIQSKELEMRVKDLLNLVDGSGDPKAQRRSFQQSNGNCYCSGFPAEKSDGNGEVSVRLLSMTPDKNDQKVNNEIYPGKHNTSPYKNYNYDKTQYQKPIYISRLDSGKVLITGKSGETFFMSDGPVLQDLTFSRMPLLHPGWLNTDSNVKNLLPVLNRIEMNYLMPIQALLEKDKLIQTLNINPSDYPTKALLLVNVLSRSLERPYLFDSEEQKSFVQVYLTLMEYTYRSLPPPPPPTMKYQKHEINMIALLQAIPIPIDDASAKKLDMLRSFLTKTDLSMITAEINTDDHPNKGSYLKALLQSLLNSDFAHDEELKYLIRYFEGKVMTTGYGAQPIEWSIVFEKKSVSK